MCVCVWGGGLVYQGDAERTAWVCGDGERGGGGKVCAVRQSVPRSATNPLSLQLIPTQTETGHTETSTNYVCVCWVGAGEMRAR
jgi:hypothetical protein